jgi:hypothetical protein
MIRTENFWWNRDNYCDSPHLRGKIDGFLRDGNRAILNRNTNGSRCDICTQTVGCAMSAGPGRPNAPTDSDDFFFLERASPNPTWIRPLTKQALARLLLHFCAMSINALCAHVLTVSWIELMSLRDSHPYCKIRNTKSVEREVDAARSEHYHHNARLASYTVITNVSAKHQPGPSGFRGTLYHT